MSLPGKSFLKNSPYPLPFFSVQNPVQYQKHISGFDFKLKIKKKREKEVEEKEEFAKDHSYKGS